MNCPITMLEFMHYFPDDNACRAYLEKMHWPNGFVCSRCEGTNASYATSQRLRKCTTCHYHASVTAGTIFHAKQTSLQKWFLAIFFVSRHKQGFPRYSFSAISALASTRLLGRCSCRRA